MKRILWLASLLAMLSLLPVSTSAQLSAGKYNLNGRGGTFQTLCLSPSLTWTSLTFPSVSGRWLNNTHGYTNLFGGGDASIGNVSIVVKGGKASWSEWTSDFSFWNMYDGLTVAFAGSC